MPANNPLEGNLSGFVALYNDGPDGLAVGGYSRDVDSRRKHAHGDPVVVNIKRARQVARDFHGWEVAPEYDLRMRAMRGF